jgi:hypothetical protein
MAYAAFRVRTGRIGTTYVGSNYMQAVSAYSKAVKEHPEEGTTLIHNGKISREHVGNFGESTSRVETTPEVTIERDRQAHRWVIVMGSHRFSTPFLDTSEPKRVINYLKARANGSLTVAINL